MVWVAMLALAMANGFFRVAVLAPRLGDAGAHVVSTAMLSALILVLNGLTVEWMAPPTVGSAVAIGAFFVILTVAFEFGFGRWVAHKSWPELLHDYDVTAGRVWVLVLVTTFVAPPLAARLRGAL